MWEEYLRCLRLPSMSPIQMSLNSTSHNLGSHTTIMALIRHLAQSSPLSCKASLITLPNSRTSSVTLSLCFMLHGNASPVQSSLVFTEDTKDGIAVYQNHCNCTRYRRLISLLCSKPVASSSSPSLLCNQYYLSPPD